MKDLVGNFVSHRAIDRRKFLMGMTCLVPILGVVGCVSTKENNCDVLVRSFTGEPWPKQKLKDFKMLDIHSHIFNLADLPTYGFVKWVIIRVDKFKPLWLALPIVRAVVRFAEYRSPTYEEEKDDLLRRAYPDFGIVTPKALETLDPTLAIKKALQDTIQSASGQKSLLDPFESRFLEDEDLIQEAIKKGLTPDEAIQAQDKNMLEKLYKEETGEKLDSIEQLTDAQIDSLVKGLMHEIQNGERDNVDKGRKIRKGFKTLGSYLKWAKLMTKPRLKMMNKLVTTFGKKGDIHYFTPLMVDFSFWVNDIRHTKLKNQVTMMRLMRKAYIGRQSNHKILPYVAFDPWRYVDYVDGKGQKDEKENPFAVLDYAFEKENELKKNGIPLVGVKIYPPMGFQVWRNSQLTKEELPKLNKEQYEAYGENFGQKLDDALFKLYEYCLDRNIPIVAHTANSNGSRKDSSIRAHPKHWLKLLKDTRKEAGSKDFSKLRINLGHFGGDHICQNNSWHIAVGKVFKSFPNSVGDIGDFELFFQGKDVRDKFLSGLDVFLNDWDEESDHICFGTDWIMLARTYDHEKYLEEVCNHMWALFLKRAQRKSIENPEILALIYMKKFMGVNGKKYIGTKGLFDSTS